MDDKLMTKEEAVRRQKKTKSVRSLAQQIGTLRGRVRRDLRSKDEKIRLTALAVALMDKTAERVGNNASAKDGHFGVTGWTKKHITISGNKVTLKYVGKSGVKQDKSFTDKTLASMMKACLKGKKATLLTMDDGTEIRSAQVNKYLKDFGITAKDIRGYRANDLLVKILKATKAPSTPEERKKTLKEAMKQVAEAVGHQQATLKKHYILPGVEESYISSGSVKKVRNAALVTRIAFLTQNVADSEYFRQLTECYVAEIIPILEGAHERMIGPLTNQVVIHIAVTDDGLPEGKVGSFQHPDDGERDGLLKISPRAFESNHWKNVALHEVIHAMLGEREDPHCEDFDILSKVMGLPVEFRD